jgi:hypothetical protein
MDRKGVPTDRPDGLHREIFRDGRLSGLGKYSRGKKTGVWKYYFRNGSLEAVGRYSAGRLEGLWKWHRENGKPLQVGRFKDGQAGRIVEEIPRERKALRRRKVRGRREKWCVEVLRQGWEAASNRDPLKPSSRSHLRPRQSRAGFGRVGLHVELAVEREPDAAVPPHQIGDALREPHHRPTYLVGAEDGALGIAHQRVGQA